VLTRLLRSDLARQYELEGRSRPGIFALPARLLHPRFLPIVLCRVARSAWLRRIPVIPALCGYLNLLLFGLEVPARCEIGPGIFFPHPSGTVVGACRIGSNVTIFQGVTLGARELDMRFDPHLRPEIGDNVTIGAGAKVLGGIRVQDDAIIGANAVVVHPVEKGGTVVGIPAVPIGRRRAAANQSR
jgi:serine O-acetyltransferase